MLRIRPSQFEVFSQIMHDRYVERMRQMLVEDFPDRFTTYSVTEIAMFVRNALEDAKSFGISSESDLTLYVRCQGLLGINFDTQPQHAWAREILERDDLDGTEKMDRIHDYLVFRHSHA